MKSFSSILTKSIEIPQSEFKVEYRIKNTVVLILIGIAMLIYTSTVATCIYPGPSAASIAKVTGLLPEIKMTHPLWQSISRLIYSIPLGSAVCRLNYFSTFCGLLSAYLIFKISGILIFEMLYDKNRFEILPYYSDDKDVPEDDYISAYVSETKSKSNDKQVFLTATYGGLVCALLFCFCAPQWIASTSFSLISFQTLLFLLTLYSVITFVFYGSIPACIASFMLCGLSITESGLYTIPLLVILLVMIKTSAQFEFFSENFILVLIFSFILGIFFDLSLLFTLHIMENGVNMGDIIPLSKNLLESHINEASRLFLSDKWILISLQTLLPLIITSKGLKAYFSYKDEIRKDKWIILFLVMSVITCYLFLNMPGSIWASAKEGYYLPVFPYISLSIAAGNIFAYWLLILKEKLQPETTDSKRIPLLIRLAGAVCIVCISATVLIQTVINFHDCDGKDAEFMDDICQLILDEAKESDYIVTEGLFDMNLLILNHQSGNRTKIVRTPPIPTESRQAGKNTNLLNKLTPKARRNSTEKQIHLERFFTSWMHQHLKKNQSIAFIRTLDALPGTLTAKPCGFVYNIYRNNPSHTINDSDLANHRQELNKIQNILSETRPERPALKKLHTFIEDHTSRVSNHLAMQLEKQNKKEEALLAYKESLETEPDNMETLYNLYGYYLRNGPAEEADRLTEVLFANYTDNKAKPKLLQNPTNSKHLQPQPPDIIFPEVLNLSRKHNIGSKNILRLLKDWHSCSTTYPVLSQPDRFLTKNRNQTKQNGYLAEVTNQLLKGENERAISLLNHYLYKEPKNLSAWTLLAEAHMNSDNFDKVKNHVIPNMKRAETNENSTIYMVQGCYHKNKPQADLDLARSYFHKALNCKEHSIVACSELLKVDRAIGDAENLKKDAEAIITIHPENAEANALLGSYYLSIKDYDRSKHHLEKALHCKKCHIIHNDLAEYHRQCHQLPQAEYHARTALRINPYYYQAWDTLSNILIGKKNFEEAEKCIKFGIFISPQSCHLDLTLAEIMIHKGDSNAAKALLKEIESNQNKNDKTIKTRCMKIRNMLSFNM